HGTADRFLFGGAQSPWGCHESSPWCTTATEHQDVDVSTARMCKTCTLWGLLDPGFKKDYRALPLKPLKKPEGDFWPCTPGRQWNSTAIREGTFMQTVCVPPEMDRQAFFGQVLWHGT